MKTVFEFIESIRGEYTKDFRIIRAIKEKDIKWIRYAARDMLACLDVRYFKFREFEDKIVDFCKKNKIQLDDVKYIEDERSENELDNVIKNKLAFHSNHRVIEDEKDFKDYVNNTGKFKNRLAFN